MHLSVLVLVALGQFQSSAPDVRSRVRDLAKEPERNRDEIIALGLQAIRPLFEIGTVAAIQLASEVKFKHLDGPLVQQIRKSTLELQIRNLACEDALLNAAAIAGIPAFSDAGGMWRFKSLSINADIVTFQELLITAALATGVDWRPVNGVLLLGTPARLWLLESDGSPCDPSIEKVVRAYLKEGRKGDAINQLMSVGPHGWGLAAELRKESVEVLTSGDMEFLSIACAPGCDWSKDALKGAEAAKMLSALKVEWPTLGKVRQGKQLIDVVSLKGLVDVVFPHLKVRWGRGAAALPLPKCIGSFNGATALSLLAVSGNIRIGEYAPGCLEIELASEAK